MERRSKLLADLDQSRSHEDPVTGTKKSVRRHRPIVLAVSTDTTNRFYFRQLLSGRDYATDDTLARQMVNFAYLFGDRHSGECLVVDPAYAVDELLAVADAEACASRAFS